MSIETTTSFVLGPMSDVQLGEGRAYAVGDRQIAVFRLSDGTLRATDAACPHNGGPSPTASPTSVSSCARCISTRSASPTAAAPPPASARSAPIRSPTRADRSSSSSTLAEPEVLTSGAERSPDPS